MYAIRNLSSNNGVKIISGILRYSSTVKSKTIKSVLSSYKDIEDPKARFQNIIDVFETKPDLMKYLNTHVGSILLAEQIRCDIQLYNTNLRTTKPTSSPNILNKVSALDVCLRDFLSTALCEDSLILKELFFESTSGYTLEKIMRGESVHAIKTIGSLKRRFREGKHCFALFHSSLPIDPLVFIHVALTNEISPSIASMVYAKQPSCAIFYSVNSPYHGLSGLDLAGRLIKRTTDKLKQEYPHVQTFSTLSPLPTFAIWMKNLLYKVSVCYFHIYLCHTYMFLLLIPPSYFIYY